MLENLKEYNIVLASKSPRRRELLKELGLEFEINALSVDEDYPVDLPADQIARYLSEKKADAYLPTLSDKELIITADTVVICDDAVLGKPKDYADAMQMLMSLSGRCHQVVTGVTLLSAQKRVSFSVSTEVYFAEISEDEARYYVDHYSPFDKAGAYGIQEWIGYVAVHKIEGSFYNVMGLPLHQLYKELKAF